MKEEVEKKKIENYIVEGSIKVAVPAYKVINVEDKIEKLLTGYVKVHVEGALNNFYEAMLQPPEHLLNDKQKFRQFMKKQLKAYIDLWLINEIGVKITPIDLDAEPEFQKYAKKAK